MGNEGVRVPGSRAAAARSSCSLLLTEAAALGAPPGHGTTPVEDVVLGQREEAAAHQPMVQILCVFSFVKMMARYAYICMVLIL